MAELNVVDTSPGGAKGQIQTPYLQTLIPGYNFGTGDGYLEFGQGTPGSLPFRVDQNGNVTAASFSTGSFDPTVIYVPAPTGATATDTPAVTAAVANLVSALAFGPAALVFQGGTYQIDSNSAVIRSVSNFAVSSAGRTCITQAPNRANNISNVTGDLFVIADCTDFTVTGLTLDCLRDTVSPMVTLSAAATSGQPSVTVAAGAASIYYPGQVIGLFGGLGSADQNKAEGLTIGTASGLTISSITPGGGSGGGDLITFTTNLANSYSAISTTPFTDGFGPYAYAGAYLTFYQTGSNTVAGRTISGEDQQCGLHMMNCQRFVIDKVTSRNLWESGIRCGTGQSSATLLTDGCQDGTITDCVTYHGYDQGIGLWLSDHITVKGCTSNASGWAGLCMTASNHCAFIGNRSLNAVYRVPGDNAEGNGLAIEGGLGNRVEGNYLAGYNNDGMRIILSPLYFGLNSNLANSPTLGAFLVAQTAAGASVNVSSSAHLSVGAQMSIIDGRSTEAVTVASVVDGTHVTFAAATAFSHASGTIISRRIPQENVIIGNVLIGPGTSGPSGGSGTNGINNLQVRGVVSGNRITGWGTGCGIQASISAVSQPASTYVGGEGSVIEGNIVYSGAGAGIVAFGTSGQQAQGYVVKNNIAYNPASNNAAIDFRAVSDTLIEGNTVYDVIGGGQGIRVDTQSSTGCNRVTVRDNIVRACQYEGIYVNVADSCVVSGNRVVSTGGGGGTYGAILLQGVTRSAVSSNVCSSNSQAGIYLTAGSGIQCQYNTVTGNICRDEGIGKNVQNGGSITQQTGIAEAGSSNNNLFAFNECDSNATAQLTVIGGGSVQTRNIISGTIQST